MVSDASFVSQLAVSCANRSSGKSADRAVKNLVLVGFANIEIVSFLPLCPEAKLMTQIDLDTIDLSNLNRQFLFRKPDISKSKALVAAATARHFNPSSGIEIHARHGNVKEATNDLEWIKGFGLVLNALDNMGTLIRPLQRSQLTKDRCQKTCQ